MNLHSNLLKDFNDDEVCAAAAEPFSEITTIKQSGLLRYATGSTSNLLIFCYGRKRGADTYGFSRVSFVTIATADDTLMFIIFFFFEI